MLRDLSKIMQYLFQKETMTDDIKKKNKIIFKQRIVFEEFCNLINIVLKHNSQDCR